MVGPPGCSCARHFPPAHFGAGPESPAGHPGPRSGCYGNLLGMENSPLDWSSAAVHSGIRCLLLKQMNDGLRDDWIKLRPIHSSTSLYPCLLLLLFLLLFLSPKPFQLYFLSPLVMIYLSRLTFVFVTCPSCHVLLHGLSPSLYHAL